MQSQGRKWTWLANQLDLSSFQIHHRLKMNSFNTIEENKIKELLEKN